MSASHPAEPVGNERRRPRISSATCLVVLKTTGVYLALESSAVAPRHCAGYRPRTRLCQDAQQDGAEGGAGGCF
jgi:hypothetical protein